jgi:hypothetical protein
MGKFPNGMKFEILTITGEQNRVLVESESEAVLANGNRYNNHYVFTFYFDNAEKILEFRGSALHLFQHRGFCRQY